MTLDDAIEYYSKTAETLRNQVRIEDNDYMDKVDEVYMCERLAEWLNELKLLRERVDAQPEQRWIPCTPDTMPDDYTDVLVWFEYYRYGDYNCLYQTYGIGSYSTEYDSWMINHETGWRKLRVLAYMPLPEPYGGEQE